MKPRRRISYNGQIIMEMVTQSTVNRSIVNITNTDEFCPLLPQYSLRSCVIFDFVVYTILAGSVCVLGILGNTLSIVVLGREKRHAATVFLLQALAFADNCLLLFSLPPMAIMRGLFPFIGERHLSNIILQYYITIVNPMAYMALTQTIFTTCVLAINRYIMVCRVFDAPTLCSLKMVRIQVAVITTFSILFNLPRFFQRRIKHTAKGACSLPTEIGTSSLFGIIYTNASFSILVFLLPFILLVALNVTIIVKLRSSWKQRRRMSRDKEFINSRAEDNMTKVMVVIIVVFLICHAPDRILQLLNLLGGKAVCGSGLFYFQAICNLLATTNSATNFIIYCMLKRHFKSALLQICHYKSSSPNSIYSTELQKQTSFHGDPQHRTTLNCNGHSPLTITERLTSL